MKQKVDVQQGPVARTALNTLDVPGALHGNDIARARFYRLTRAGHKLLAAETRDWEQTAAIIARFFEVKAGDVA
jgi:DNA-binding transcriptional regulator PaaX